MKRPPIEKDPEAVKEQFLTPFLDVRLFTFNGEVLKPATGAVPGQWTITVEDILKDSSSTSKGRDGGERGLGEGEDDLLMQHEDSVKPLGPDYGKKKKRKKGEPEEELKGWFGMKRKDPTEEELQELRAIQLRGVADPKRFYKASDSRAVPTHFQFAREINSGPAVSASGKASQMESTRRKRQGRSILQELMESEDASQWSRRRTDEIRAEREAGGLRDYKRKMQERYKRAPKNPAHVQKAGKKSR
uniref:Fcf2 pre-rRNA processing C-terminal domain-containing protein n=1 Tax=Chromera velia CCMP2878 TaxID=1169474 RepID=A0A0G4HPB1_9ALVE|eukprot:Cvel_29763.t1-p1 / transcript=Cvel_29763.t1 / gene=Cvel_29763 / organism=Chromera_velia_CCMP2878 / gene_product=Deoxynucleotidyltransferase terminal-interacting, putative / transcript_product=Deoxynucleotidyltransferase terminal-interacting, putative / location=Cvel_scaffold4133:6579-10693(+) / protein_length=245 / sequence_SO=supercontig / SO=protein_coding / is_pseudo=false